jgi:hypothetical protein
MICHSSASTQSATTGAARPLARKTQAAQAAACGRYDIALGIWLRRTHTDHMRAHFLRAEEPAP